MGVSPFGLIIQPPVSPQQTARIEKSHCPQHFLDLRPLPQRQGWLRTYFDIWGKAPGETFSPEEFTARKPRWNQWATDRGLGVDPQQSPCRAIHKSDHPVYIEQDAPLPHRLEDIFQKAVFQRQAHDDLPHLAVLDAVQPGHELDEARFHGKVASGRISVFRGGMENVRMVLCSSPTSIRRDRLAHS